MTTLSATLKKRLRLQENLRADLARSQQAELFKLYADLLYAQPGKLPKGTERIKVVNLFDPQLTDIEIPLDPRASLIQNANRYNKSYQKANRAVPLLRAKMQRLEAEIKLLKSQLQELSAEMSGSDMIWRSTAAAQELQKKNGSWASRVCLWGPVQPIRRRFDARWPSRLFRQKGWRFWLGGAVRTTTS